MLKINVFDSRWSRYRRAISDLLNLVAVLFGASVGFGLLILVYSVFGYANEIGQDAAEMYAQQPVVYFVLLSLAVLMNTSISYVAARLSGRLLMQEEKATREKRFREECPY